MALNPQQFQQLPMFMTAHDLMTQAKPGDLGIYRDRDPQPLWDKKLHDAVTKRPIWKGSETLAESIRARGVQEPVTLRWSTQNPQPTLSDGHHRVAAANSISPDTFVPVKHIDLGRRWME